MAALVMLPGAAASAKPRFTTVPGPSQANARFTVTYKGGGNFHTVFHATPPNPGHKSDTNDAHDTSTQTWDVKYRGALTVPACGQAADGSGDPCDALAGLTGLRGATKATGRVNHKHVDGIYRQLDRTVTCKLSESPSRHRVLDGSLNVRYIPDSQSIGISASDPVETALSLFPQQCPSQGDSIDRIADFYATPGFSFAQGFGPEVWFASREVVIPVSAFHHSKTIRVPLHDTPAGTPPRKCAVNNPEYERCRTGGAWNGVLTLKSGPAKASARVSAARVKYTAPKSGTYNGRAGSHRKLFFSLNGNSIDIFAFDFTCGNTTGRTSLNGITVKKTKKGYTFLLKAHGSVSYRDDHPDQNAAVQVSGRFGRSGRAAVGTLKVKTPRCGTGTVDWSAKR
jgi:hypothetical protein